MYINSKLVNHELKATIENNRITFHQMIKYGVLSARDENKKGIIDE